ncbi:HYR domain-containing protein [Tritonibacter mobilis]|uniref:HYR domain-containing protein n=1 Tax=Tritonibacter mobilis TaxID=379347 RepID=UPI00399002AB
MVGVGTCNAVATGPASSPFYTEGTLNISISVTDTEPPVITPPGAQSASTDAGTNTATLDVTSLGSVTDNSGTTPAITYAIGGTPLAGAYAFPIGVTTVTMDASDGAGNAAVQESFTVTVTDGEVPVITPPGAQSASTDAGTNTATLDVTSLGSVTDNSGTTPTITYAIGGTPLAGAYAFPIGVTTVTMDASDGAGNAAVQQSFTVTVTDGEVPVITPPGPQSAPTDTGVNTATLDVTSLGSVTDNSGTTPAITYAIGGTPLSGAYAFPIGVTTVTMDASDGAGNAAVQESFTVTVTDGEVPVITAPGPQSASTDAGANTATLDVTSLGSVTDNSGTTPAITYAIGGTPLAGAYAFPIGVTTVTMDASDGAGNAAVQESFTVTVTDGEVPVITPPGAQSASTDAGTNTAMLDVTSLGSVTDNSGTTPTITYAIGGTPLAGAYAFPIGVTTVTMDASDGAGNAAVQQSFTVTVTDSEVPVITPPGPQSAPTDTGVNTATLDVTSLGSVTDNSGTTPTITYAIGGTPLAGLHAFPMGVTTVTMDASDGAGNAAVQQSFTVTVTDGEVPVITPPGAQSASTDAGTNTATLDVTSLGSVTDNSGTTPTITYAIGGTPLAGAYAFPIGVTTVTMDASDDVGNAATQQSFTVTVTDSEAPVITAPADQTAPADIGGVTATLDVTNLGSVTDNSGPTPSITYRAGSTILTGPHVFPLGVTTVTMDAIDSAGNAATQVSFTVTITDNEAPTVTLTTNTTQVAAGDRVVVNIAFSEPVTGFHGSELNLGNATLTSLSGTGTAWVATLSAIGGGDVTVSVPAGAATDAAGNGNEMSNTLSVRDTTITETQTQISQFMQSRVDLLLKNQPELAHLLLGSETGRLNSQVSRGTGTFNFANRSDAPVWMMLNGSWTNESDRDLTYLFGSIGSHIKVNPNLLVGGMLQFDHMDQTDGAAEVQGTGWLAGPYFVARLPEQDLYFDGRLLYGQSSNKITPFGTYTDKFDTNRLLASLQVSGALDYGEVDIIPSLKASYAREAQSAYTDTPGNRIPKQTVELGQIEAGLAFVAPMPLYTGEGEMTLTGGVKAIGSFVNGSGHASSVSPDYEGGRARIDLGMMHRMVNGGQFQIQSYYDGIGASGYDSYGISFRLEYQF